MAYKFSYRMPAPHYVMFLFVYLPCWVKGDKFIFRNGSHDMFQALAE